MDEGFLTLATPAVSRAPGASARAPAAAGPGPAGAPVRQAASEQLRLFDQALPSARIALPAAPAATVPCPRAAAYEVVARSYGLRTGLLPAVVAEESGGRTAAVSSRGARGLMQVRPGTAARYGVSARDLDDPLVNLATGAAELRRLQDRFGTLDLTLAGYNAGEGAVLRHGRRIPPYDATQRYVRRITSRLGAPDAAPRCSPWTQR